MNIKAHDIWALDFEKTYDVQIFFEITFHQKLEVFLCLFSSLILVTVCPDRLQNKPDKSL